MDLGGLVVIAGKDGVLRWGFSISRD